MLLDIYLNSPVEIITGARQKPGFFDAIAARASRGSAREVKRFAGLNFAGNAPKTSLNIAEVYWKIWTGEAQSKCFSKFPLCFCNFGAFPAKVENP